MISFLRLKEQLRTAVLHSCGLPISQIEKLNRALQKEVNNKNIEEGVEKIADVRSFMYVEQV